jgi:hypothetical protein
MSELAQPVRIEILKWKKHNPRSDYKSMPWFKCSANLYRDRSLHGLPAETKWTWVCLLCLAAEENKAGFIEGDLGWLADSIKADPAVLQHSLEVFEKKGLIAITYVSRTSDVRETFVPRSLHNEENEEKKVNPEVSAFDLAFAADWLSWARTRIPNLKANEPKWVNASRLLREKDGLSEDELRGILDFVRDDHFWQHNAVSLEGLRSKSKNGLKKVENIIAAMRQRPSQPPRPKNKIPVVSSREELKCLLRS